VTRGVCNHATVQPCYTSVLTCGARSLLSLQHGAEITASEADCEHEAEQTQRIETLGHRLQEGDVRLGLRQPKFAEALSNEP
jgi:hypothetical protein